MFIVEGNIGAGKSTFLSLFQTAHQNYQVAQEPLHNWTSEHYGKSLLQEFYKSPSRWAFTLETFAMIARALDHTKNHTLNKSITVMERSIYSGHYCFALNDKASGYFNEVEWAVYEHWVNFLLEQKCKPPQGFIYLRAHPTTCHQRINARARKGEELISQEYLEKIHAWHEKFLIEKTTLDSHLKHVPVLILDAEKDFSNNKEAFKIMANKATEFINKHA